MKANVWNRYKLIISYMILSLCLSFVHPGQILVSFAQSREGDTPREPPVSVGPVDGQTYAVVVEGSHAYIGVERRLMIIDVSDPTASVVLGESTDLPGPVKSLQVVDRYAYLAIGKGGLAIFDISDPSAPFPVGGFDTPGDTSGVYVSGELVYIADGAAGTHIIDVVEPSNPVIIGTTPTEGWDWEVVVVGGMAYIAADAAGLRVVDVADSTSPRQIGSFATSGDATGIFVEGGFAYVAAGSSGLWILDVSQPAEPVVASIADAEYARNVHIQNGFAYVSTERKGVLVINVHNPKRPTRIRRFAASRSANMISVADDDLFVADGVGGLLTVRVSASRGQERRREFLPLRSQAR